MLIEVTQSGFDPTLNDREYTETRECEHCHAVYSFRYFCSYTMDLVIKAAKLRGNGTEYGDVCTTCREVLSRGHYQPRLF